MSRSEALSLLCTWWRHQMETFSALLALCAVNWSVTVNSPHKGEWRIALMFSLSCAWINGLVNNRDADDLRRHPAHYDVIVMHKDEPLCEFRLCGLCCNTIQWDAVIMRAFVSRILTVDTPYLARGSEVWVSFVNPYYDWCVAAVVAILCVISWHIVPRYNGTALYISASTSCECGQ